MVLCLFFRVLKGWEFSHLSFMNEENKGALVFINLGTSIRTEGKYSYEIDERCICVASGYR